VKHFEDCMHRFSIDGANITCTCLILFCSQRLSSDMSVIIVFDSRNFYSLKLTLSLFFRFVFFFIFCYSMIKKHRDKTISSIFVSNSLSVYTHRQVWEFNLHECSWTLLLLWSQNYLLLKGINLCSIESMIIRTSILIAITFCRNRRLFWLDK